MLENSYEVQITRYTSKGKVYTICLNLTNECIEGDVDFKVIEKMLLEAVSKLKSRYE